MKADFNFNKFYTENYSKILNHVVIRVKNREVAEELTNDVFLKIREKISLYDEQKSGFNTWVYTVANNTIIDYFRASKNEKQVQQISDFQDEEGRETLQIPANDGRTTAATEIETQELSQEMLKAFRGLKPSYRRVAIQYFLRQKQYDEIAETLNIPIGSVKGMIFRVREMLQSQLKPVYQTL
jgi:RNA polymerase sigma-70 factor (ECF subfamily)